MIPLDIFRENIRKCWQFALDVTWDQNIRHPELSRGQCLEERSYLHTLLGTNQAEVFLKARKMADEVSEQSEMNVLLPEVMQFVEEHKYPVTLENPEFELVDCGEKFGRRTLSGLACRIFPMDGGEGHFVAKLRNT